MAEISKMLPGYNCGQCGHRQCRDYAEEILKNGDLGKCPYLELERFSNIKMDIEEYLSTHTIVEHAVSKNMVPAHFIDAKGIEDHPAHCRGCGDGTLPFKGNYRADFSLGGFPGEPSCREDLYPFARPRDIEPGDILRYRPLGCPVIHFAEVMKFNKGIATVHLAGPHQLMGAADFKYKDLGICMVTGFEGAVNEGRVPSVGETVKFLPSHCRMHQIHSGVVVQSEGNRLRIEGIDLKVWR
ncbi:MAG: (Fe-S)-binding protein [Methanotrichaceae archaeon]